MPCPARSPLFAVLLTACATAPAQAQTTLARGGGATLETFGYGRAGLGATLEDGGDQTCFQAPGADAKYRLGNECELYLEPGLTLRFREGEGEPSIAVTGRLSVYSGPINDFDDTIIAVEESYVELDAIAPGALGGGGLWAGMRFYRRRDVHINDYYWWDMSGLGFGLEEAALGVGKASVAFFPRSGFDLEDALERDDGFSRLDTRLSDIAVTGSWSLDLGADLRFAPGEAESDFGSMLTMAWTRAKTLGGEAVLAFQAGLGAGASLSNISDTDASAGDLAGRALATTTFALDGGVVGQAVALAEWRSDGREWISAGIRPVIPLHGPLYLAVEGGVDHVWDAGGASRTLGKATAALEYKPSGGAFFDRPVGRLFVTTAAWDDGADNAGIAPDLDGRAGITVGAQVEHWW